MDVREEPASTSEAPTSPGSAESAEPAPKKVARHDGPPVNARQALKARMEALESDTATAPADSHAPSSEASGARYIAMPS
jgi:hypothetical protein